MSAQEPTKQPYLAKSSKNATTMDFHVEGGPSKKMKTGTIKDSLTAGSSLRTKNVKEKFSGSTKLEEFAKSKERQSSKEAVKFQTDKPGNLKQKSMNKSKPSNEPKTTRSAEKSMKPQKPNDKKVKILFKKGAMKKKSKVAVFWHPPISWPPKKLKLTKQKVKNNKSMSSNSKNLSKSRSRTPFKSKKSSIPSSKTYSPARSSSKHKLSSTSKHRSTSLINDKLVFKPKDGEPSSSKSKLFSQLGKLPSKERMLVSAKLKTPSNEKRFASNQKQSLKKESFILRSQPSSKEKLSSLQARKVSKERLSASKPIIPKDESFSFKMEESSTEKLTLSKGRLSSKYKSSLKRTSPSKDRSFSEGKLILTSKDNAQSLSKNILHSIFKPGTLSSSKDNPPALKITPLKIDASLSVKSSTSLVEKEALDNPRTSTSPSTSQTKVTLLKNSPLLEKKPYSASIPPVSSKSTSSSKKRPWTSEERRPSTSKPGSPLSKLHNQQKTKSGSVLKSPPPVNHVDPVIVHATKWTRTPSKLTRRKLIKALAKPRDLSRPMTATEKETRLKAIVRLLPLIKRPVITSKEQRSSSTENRRSTSGRKQRSSSKEPSKKPYRSYSNSYFRNPFTNSSKNSTDLKKIKLNSWSASDQRKPDVSKQLESPPGTDVVRPFDPTTKQLPVDSKDLEKQRSLHSVLKHLSGTTVSKLISPPTLRPFPTQEPRGPTKVLKPSHPRQEPHDSLKPMGLQQHLSGLSKSKDSKFRQAVSSKPNDSHRLDPFKQRDPQSQSHDSIGHKEFRRSLDFSKHCLSSVTKINESPRAVRRDTSKSIVAQEKNVTKKRKKLLEQLSSDFVTDVLKSRYLKTHWQCPQVFIDGLAKRLPTAFVLASLQQSSLPSVSTTLQSSSSALVPTTSKQLPTQSVFEPPKRLQNVPFFGHLNPPSSSVPKMSRQFTPARSLIKSVSAVPKRPLTGPLLTTSKQTSLPSVSSTSKNSQMGSSSTNLRRSPTGPVPATPRQRPSNLRKPSTDPTPLSDASKRRRDLTKRLTVTFKTPNESSEFALRGPPKQAKPSTTIKDLLKKSKNALKNLLGVSEKSKVAFKQPRGPSRKSKSSSKNRKGRKFKNHWSNVTPQIKEACRRLKTAKIRFNARDRLVQREYKELKRRKNSYKKPLSLFPPVCPRGSESPTFARLRKLRRRFRSTNLTNKLDKRRKFSKTLYKSKKPGSAFIKKPLSSSKAKQSAKSSDKQRSIKLDDRILKAKLENKLRRPMTAKVADNLSKMAKLRDKQLQLKPTLALQKQESSSSSKPRTESQSTVKRHQPSESAKPRRHSLPKPLNKNEQKQKPTAKSLTSLKHNTEKDKLKLRLSFKKTSSRHRNLSGSADKPSKSLSLSINKIHQKKSASRSLNSRRRELARRAKWHPPQPWPPVRILCKLMDPRKIVNKKLKNLKLPNMLLMWHPPRPWPPPQLRRHLKSVKLAIRKSKTLTLMENENRREFLHRARVHRSQRQSIKERVKAVLTGKLKSRKYKSPGSSNFHGVRKRATVKKKYVKVRTTPHKRLSKSRILKKLKQLSSLKPSTSKCHHSSSRSHKLFKNCHLSEHRDRKKHLPSKNCHWRCSTSKDRTPSKKYVSSKTSVSSKRSSSKNRFSKSRLVSKKRQTSKNRVSNKNHTSTKGNYSLKKHTSAKQQKPSKGRILAENKSFSKVRATSNSRRSLRDNALSKICTSTKNQISSKKYESAARHRSASNICTSKKKCLSSKKPRSSKTWSSTKHRSLSKRRKSSNNPTSSQKRASSMDRNFLKIRTSSKCHSSKNISSLKEDSLSKNCKSSHCTSSKNRNFLKKRSLSKDCRSSKVVVDAETSSSMKASVKATNPHNAEKSVDKSKNVKKVTDNQKSTWKSPTPPKPAKMVTTIPKISDREISELSTTQKVTVKSKTAEKTIKKSTSKYKIESQPQSTNNQMDMRKHKRRSKSINTSDPVKSKSSSESVNTSKVLMATTTSKPNYTIAASNFGNLTGSLKTLRSALSKPSEKGKLPPKPKAKVRFLLLHKGTNKLKLRSPQLIAKRTPIPRTSKLGMMASPTLSLRREKIKARCRLRILATSARYRAVIKNKLKMRTDPLKVKKWLFDTFMFQDFVMQLRSLRASVFSLLRNIDVNDRPNVANDISLVKTELFTFKKSYKKMPKSKLAMRDMPVLFKTRLREIDRKDRFLTEVCGKEYVSKWSFHRQKTRSPNHHKKRRSSSKKQRKSYNNVVLAKDKLKLKRTSSKEKPSKHCFLKTKSKPKRSTLKEKLKTQRSSSKDKLKNKRSSSKSGSTSKQSSTKVKMLKHSSSKENVKLKRTFSKEQSTSKLSSLKENLKCSLKAKQFPFTEKSNPKRPSSKKKSTTKLTSANKKCATKHLPLKDKAKLTRTSLKKKPKGKPLDSDEKPESNRLSSKDESVSTRSFFKKKSKRTPSIEKPKRSPKKRSKSKRSSSEEKLKHLSSKKQSSSNPKRMHSKEKLKPKRSSSTEKSKINRSSSKNKQSPSNDMQKLKRMSTKDRLKLKRSSSTERQKKSSDTTKIKKHSKSKGVKLTTTGGVQGDTKQNVSSTAVAQSTKPAKSGESFLPVAGERPKSTVFLKTVKTPVAVSSSNVDSTQIKTSSSSDAKSSTKTTESSKPSSTDTTGGSNPIEKSKERSKASSKSTDKLQSASTTERGKRGKKSNSSKLKAKSKSKERLVSEGHKKDQIKSKGKTKDKKKQSSSTSSSKNDKMQKRTSASKSSESDPSLKKKLKPKKSSSKADSKDKGHVKKSKTSSTKTCKRSASSIANAPSILLNDVAMHPRREEPRKRLHGSFERMQHASGNKTRCRRHLPLTLPARLRLENQSRSRSPSRRRKIAVRENGMRYGVPARAVLSTEGNELPARLATLAARRASTSHVTSANAAVSMSTVDPGAPIELTGSNTQSKQRKIVNVLSAETKMAGKLCSSNVDDICEGAVVSSENRKSTKHCYESPTADGNDPKMAADSSKKTAKNALSTISSYSKADTHNLTSAKKQQIGKDKLAAAQQKEPSTSRSSKKNAPVAKLDKLKMKKSKGKKRRRQRSESPLAAHRRFYGTDGFQWRRRRPPVMPPRIPRPPTPPSPLPVRKTRPQQVPIPVQRTLKSSARNLQCVLKKVDRLQSATTAAHECTRNYVRNKRRFAFNHIDRRVLKRSENVVQKYTEALKYMVQKAVRQNTVISETQLRALRRRYFVNPNQPRPTIEEDEFRSYNKYQQCFIPRTTVLFTTPVKTPAPTDVSPPTRSQRSGHENLTEHSLRVTLEAPTISNEDLMADLDTDPVQDDDDMNELDN